MNNELSKVPEDTQEITLPLPVTLLILISIAIITLKTIYPIGLNQMGPETSKFKINPIVPVTTANFI